MKGILLQSEILNREEDRSYTPYDIIWIYQSR